MDIKLLISMLRCAIEGNVIFLQIDVSLFLNYYHIECVVAFG